jgi:hypothetical protein
MDLVYKDEMGKLHKVRVHNFRKDDETIVRVMGDIKLNPTDRHYPDKKWVKIKDVFVLEPVKFSSNFILSNQF